MVKSSIEDVAQEIFGPEHPESIERWVDYWKGTRQRCKRLMQAFEPLVPMDFRGKSVLDLGCGQGGLGELLVGRCHSYTGADLHHHVLQFAQAAPGQGYVQCNGISLPFRDQSFDVIFAFDVVEHLVGGSPWQVQCLRELRRVLRPLGMIFITTPNRWYPYEGHTHLYFPQYLPSLLRDRYIHWENPGFLKEHTSFAEIRSLGPLALKRCLRKSRLSFLHSFPCAMDLVDYRRQFPVRACLAYLGLGWCFHAEFWGILAREEARQKLRLKLKPLGVEEAVSDFQSLVDFGEDSFGSQLGPGWYWHESDRRGFRWTGQEAVGYLETARRMPYLNLHGYAAEKNYLEISVNGLKVGEYSAPPQTEFRLQYLAPFVKTHEIWEVAIHCRRTFRSQDPHDKRDLGVMVFSFGLAETAASQSGQETASA